MPENEVQPGAENVLQEREVISWVKEVPHVLGNIRACKLPFNFCRSWLRDFLLL